MAACCWSSVGLTQSHDPLLGDAEPLFDSGETGLPALSQKADYPKIIKFDQTYSFQYSHIKSEMGDFYIPGYVEDENDHLFDNKYGGILKIETSPKTYHYYDYSLYLRQQKDDDNYDESNGFLFHEAYIHHQQPKHSWRFGFQILKLGKLDFDSVINVLNKNYNSDFGLYQTNTDKQPVASINYKLFNNKNALTLYFSPLKNESVGEIFTRNRNNLDKVVKEKKRDDKRVTVARGGIQYQWNFENLDLRFSMFHWADPDNKIYFKYTKEDVDALAAAAAGTSLPYNYSEEETTFNFAAIEIDASFWGLVFKMDAGIFNQKNIYHLKSVNGVTEMKSFAAPYRAVSASLEKQWESFLMMGIVSYRRVDDVPDESQVLYMDGADQPESYLHRYQYTLLTKYDFNDVLSGTITYFETRPKSLYESNSTDLVMVGESVLSSQQIGYSAGLLFDDQIVKWHLMVVNLHNQVKTNSIISFSQSTLGVSFKF